MGCTIVRRGEKRAALAPSGACPGRGQGGWSLPEARRFWTIWVQFLKGNNYQDWIFWFLLNPVHPGLQGIPHCVWVFLFVCLGFFTHTCMETSPLPMNGFNFDLCSALIWPLSSEGSLACHTYSDMGHPFIYYGAFGSEAVNTCACDLGLSRLLAEQIVKIVCIFPILSFVSPMDSKHWPSFVFSWVTFN